MSMSFLSPPVFSWTGCESPLGEGQDFKCEEAFGDRGTSSPPSTGPGHGDSTRDSLGPGLTQVSLSRWLTMGSGCLDQPSGIESPLRSR